MRLLKQTLKAIGDNKITIRQLGLIRVQKKENKLCREEIEQARRAAARERGA